MPIIIDMVVLTSGEVSQKSLSFRFNAVTVGVKEHQLLYFTNIDYNTHFAIAALVKEGDSWKGVATARFIEDSETPSVAEWAAIVLDRYHAVGIGSILLFFISTVRRTVGITGDGASLRHQTARGDRARRELPCSPLDEEGERDAPAA